MELDFSCSIYTEPSKTHEQEQSDYRAACIIHSFHLLVSGTFLSCSMIGTLVIMLHEAVLNIPFAKIMCC